MDVGFGFINTHESTADWDSTLVKAESGLLDRNLHVFHILGRRFFRRRCSDQAGFWEQHHWELRSVFGSRSRMGFLRVQRSFALAAYILYIIRSSEVGMAVIRRLTRWTPTARTNHVHPKCTRSDSHLIVYCNPPLSSTMCNVRRSDCSHPITEPGTVPNTSRRRAIYSSADG